MKSGFIKVMGVVALLSLAAAPAIANIYLDENFEDASPFTNLSYPVADGTTFPTAPMIAGSQGINVRASGTGAGNTTPEVVFSNTGTINSTYAFSGTQSLQLASGQSFGVVNSDYALAAGNWYNVIQLAVAVDAATLALPSATQVGRITLNYSTDGVTAPAEVVFQLNLVRNASGGVDVIVQNNSVKAGEIPVAGEWVMITLIAQKDIAAPKNWECWDPLTATYKGPQPVGDPINSSGTYATIENGISVFVNSNTAGAHINAATLGSNWANDPAAIESEKANRTVLLNWQVAAENGGALYVDEGFWCHNLLQDDKGVDANTQDAAARMNVFGPPPVPPTGASSWTLYNQ